MTVPAQNPTGLHPRCPDFSPRQHDGLLMAICFPPPCPLPPALHTAEASQITWLRSTALPSHLNKGPSASPDWASLAFVSPPAGVPSFPHASHTGTPSSCTSTENKHLPRDLGMGHALYPGGSSPTSACLTSPVPASLSERALLLAPRLP